MANFIMENLLSTEAELGISGKGGLVTSVVLELTCPTSWMVSGTGCGSASSSPAIETLKRRTCSFFKA